MSAVNAHSAVSQQASGAVSGARGPAQAKSEKTPSPTSSSDTFKSYESLQAMAPEVYNQMTQSIAMQMCTQQENFQKKMQDIYKEYKTGD